MASGKGDVFRIEDEYVPTPEEAVLSRLPADFPQLPEESDEDLQELKNFRISEAWNNLFKLNGIHQIMLSPEYQKKMGLEVGVNISQEFPWKQIKFRTFVENYIQTSDKGSINLKDFEDFKPDDLILLGYVPVLTQNNTEIDIADPFIVYDNHFAQRKASQIVKNIQIYEKWLLNKMVTKKSRPWKSLGSEKIVDLGLKIDKSEVVDVELQSCYPMSLSQSTFNFRTTSDIRDGYVELVPGDRKFDNISRRRINIGIQQSPARVTLEQQTDPTFPTNAWAQYLFEITEEGDCLDEESEEEEDKKKPKKGEPVVEVIKKPIEVSDQVKLLLNSLEFNQIDMYRNDYPLISTVVVPKYSNPYLEELLCFADISKSLNRYVCGVDWYPTTAGLLVTSYAFTTPAISIDINDKTDFVFQTIFEKNPVLMWSFSDSLQPKLDFQSPRQVTALSFCPYNGNILIGGTINGQVIIWDLLNRVEKLDYEEMLTTAQTKYRIIMSSHLDWSQQIDEQFAVYPAIVTALDTSQNGPITSIKWLPRNQIITADGKHIETFKHVNRFFITNSIDGTLAVWNLDINLDKKISQKGTKIQLPKQLMQNESTFRKYDRIFKPIFKIGYNEPLTGTICETAQITYKPYNYTKSLRDFTIKYPIKVITEVFVQKSKSLLDVDNTHELKKKSHKLISSTFFGQIATYTWDGLDFDAGAPVNKEDIIISSKFANCHDGPILALEQNPHYQKIFASVGRYILAIWKEDFLFTPIMWRIRPCELTNIKWSVDRPSVLFITRTDGVFESWDILARDDQPILADSIGGGIVTTLSEHRPSIPKKIIGIGDYNSSFRMIALPANFEGQEQNEKTLLKNYVDKEVERKQEILEWEKNWLVKNADILEAKKIAEQEALIHLELLKKEAEEEAAAINDKEDDTKKKLAGTTQKKSFDLPEILEKKWDEMNLKRLMDVLMLRKQVNAAKLERETALEKKRLAYQKSKKTALKKKYLKKIDEDIATVRARILPTAKEDINRIELVSDSINAILEESPNYHEIETESIEFMQGIEKYGEISYADFFQRGRQRRILLNKSLGSNTARLQFYNNLKLSDQLNELNFGCASFIALENRSRDFGASGDNLSWGDLDQIPVKDRNIYGKGDH